MRKQTGPQLTITTRSRSREERIEKDQGPQEIKQELSEEWLNECGQRVVEPDTSSVTSSSDTGPDSPLILTEEGRESSSSLQVPVEDQDTRDMAEARAPIITPSKFRGTQDENVEEYLTQFERASKANGWDANRKLVIIPCYLEGAALRWYENAESRLGAQLTWDQVKEGLKSTFQSIAYDEQIEFKLRMRMQRDEETVESYVQDVLYLCAKVDPNMPERSKIKYVLRGLKPSLIEKVMPMNNESLEDLMTNLRTVQTARYLAGQRVDHLLTEPMSAGSRGELTRSPLPTATNPSNLERKIENLTAEFAKFSMRLMAEQNETRRVGDRNHQGRGFVHNRERNERGRGAFRGARGGRTRDGRVICFRCGRPGHFAVACRTSQSGNATEER